MASSSSSAAASAAEDTLTLKGFVSYVEMQDDRGHWKKAKVYKKVVENNKVTCYLASIAGVQYRIAWYNDNINRDGAAGFFYVNGKCLQSYLVGKQEPRGRLALCEGHRESRTTLQPLIFGKPTTTDREDLAVQDAQIYQNMGSISVKLLRINMAAKPAATYPLKPKAFPEQDILLETRKKNQVTHVTKFGSKLIETSPCTYPKYTNIDSDTEPYVVFEWKYRSKNFLEATGTIPTTCVEPHQRRPAEEMDIDAPEDAGRRLESIAYEIELGELRKANAALRARVHTMARVIDLTLSDSDDDD